MAPVPMKKNLTELVFILDKSGSMALLDAIRNAISLGGDSDTLAAITGSIAEAAYGVPRKLEEKAWEYLDEPLREVLCRWKRRVEL